MNEYERERAERIRQNMERMKAMDLLTMAAKVARPQKVTKPPSQRGLSAKKKRLADGSGERGGAPRRRSARLQGEAADGAEVVSERHGGVITARIGGLTTNGRDIKAFSTINTSLELATAPEERHPKGDVPFTSNNGTTATDEDFLNQILRTLPSKRPDHSTKALPMLLPLTKYNDLRLRENDVAKVTKNSITHLAFCSSQNGNGLGLIVAAADKRGGIGLWNVDHEIQTTEPNGTLAEGSDDASSLEGALEGVDGVQKNSFDGVLAFNGVHYQYVSGLKWGNTSHGTETLYTCSYDGSVRQLDPEKGIFSLVWGDEDREYSCFDVSPDGCTVYLGDNEGVLDVIDIRSRQRTVKLNGKSSILDIHNRKVNTVQVDPGSSSMIVTASTDATIALWDVRKLKASTSKTKAKAVASASHHQTCQSAYFAPDGSQRVVSTSFDNTVRIWDGKKGLAQQASIRHDNQTGRWVLPFRAVWGSNSDAVIVGNMRRYVDVYDAHTGELTTQLSSEWMSAIPSRNSVHPTLPVIASGTASGRVHIFRMDASK